ncbi:hypothetical protein HRbin15_01860 [bacterium HR15]|nr:hypothetical protein HRbin15_01860 [bacterium HR15]
MLSYDPNDPGSWQPSKKFVFIPYPDRSVWEQRAKVERELIIYIDEYAYYWQLCPQNGRRPIGGDQCITCCGDPDPQGGTQFCWVPREGWDGTPDFSGNFGPPQLCGYFYFPEAYDDAGRRCPSEWQWFCLSRRELRQQQQEWLCGTSPPQPRPGYRFHCKVTTVPICKEIGQSADASVDNRPVCPAPEQPLTYAKFGTYTYLGGLFVGQVPWRYGNRDWQSAPDLSGTGRTLLRFYNPDGFPTQVDAACLSLVYTATPNGVALSSPLPKPIGVCSLSPDWQESEVSWQFLKQQGLHTPFTSGWIGTTRDLGDEHNPIRPRGDEIDAVDVDGSGNVKVFAESQWQPTTIKRVIIPIPLGTLSAQGQYVSLLLTLQPEAIFEPDSSAPPTWYYFLGKEHPLANERTFPRLWYVVKQN